MFGGKGIGLFNGGPVHADFIVCIGLVTDFLEPESAGGFSFVEQRGSGFSFLSGSNRNGKVVRVECETGRGDALAAQADAGRGIFRV